MATDQPQPDRIEAATEEPQLDPPIKGLTPTEKAARRIQCKYAQAAVGLLSTEERADGIRDILHHCFAPALRALKAMELLHERKWSIILVHHSGAWSVLDTCCKFLGESDDPTSAVLKAAGEKSDA